MPPFIDPSPGCQGLGALAARHQTLAQARKIFALQTSPAPASQACGHLMQIEHFQTVIQGSSGERVLSLHNAIMYSLQVMLAFVSGGALCVR